MNPSIQNTFMILRFEAYEQDNKFTKEQRDELVSIIDEISDLELPVLSPWKFAKNLNKIEKALNEYDFLFKKLGGNTERLERKLKEARDMNRKAALPFLRK